MLACLTNPLYATFTTTGAIAPIVAPADVRAGALQSDTTGFAFVERASYVLPTDISVDVTNFSNLTIISDISQFTPGIVAAGSFVDVYMIHVDAANGPKTYSGNITIGPNQQILGVIVSTNLLNASHASLGFPTTTYGSSPLIGVEFMRPNCPNCGRDSLIVNSLGVGVRFASLVGIDEVRVIVSATPEPGTWALLAVGLMGVGFLQRRRNLAAAKAASRAR